MERVVRGHLSTACRSPLLPAVDVTGGRLGAYRPEGPEPVDAFGGDPVEAARSAARAGARWLHVVDMDLAFGGEVRNADVVAAVAALDGIRVQASGGIRTWEEARAYLDAGASGSCSARRRSSDEAGGRAPPGAAGSRGRSWGSKSRTGGSVRGAPAAWTWT